MALRGSARLLLVALLLATGCDGTAAGRSTSSSPAAVTPAPSLVLPPTPSRSSTPAASPAETSPLERLGVEGLVGQLLMPYVYGSGADRVSATQRSANLALYGVGTPAEVVRRWHLGGVMLIDRNTLDPVRSRLSTGNVGSAAQIRSLTDGLQRAARADSGIPLLVSTDQEGGTVQRVSSGVTALPAQAQLSRLPAAALRCVYRRLGSQLRDLGINQDLAPVADVARTSRGVIGDRSFGPDAGRDAAAVRIAVGGLQSAGILATLKHWPGHGSTTTDSHAALAVVSESRAAWQSVDRVPFAAGTDEAAAVMVGHLAVPALDPSGRPATFSPVLIRSELRRRLGFRGLVLTDSLWMEPARAVGSPGAAGLAALAAGNDVLLMPYDLPRVQRALVDAARRDPVVLASVRAAVARVLVAKARVQPGPAPSQVSCG